MAQVENDSMTDDDSDDPIVKEIPIFHSKRLQDNLYLFQYPQRPKNCTNEVNIRKCFFKPENKEVKLEIDIATASSNFDEVKARDIARQVDGDPDTRKTEKNVYFDNNIADKVVYTSSEVESEPHNYAVGTFNGKELHLTTLKGIFHLTPNFTCIDKGLKRKKEAENDDDSDVDEEPGPSSAEQVTVKFKRSDDRWQKYRENTYDSLLAKSAKEPWIECTWYDQESTKSGIQRLQLYSENTEDTGQARNLSDAEYVRLLVPEEEQATMEPTLPSHVMSLHALRALPVQEQCRMLLKDAQIISFQQLMMLVGSKGVTSDALLKMLRKVAVLVRGNWVVKSEVLYPKDTFSPTSGVPAELMCRARDYVLYLFTKNEYVERKKVSSVMKIPSEEMKEIFTGISKLRHNKGWELTLPTDIDFIHKNGELVKEQARKWDEWFVQHADILRANCEKKQQRRKSKSVSEDARKNGALNSNSSDNDSGVEKNKSPVVARKNKVAKVNSNSCSNLADMKNS